jgi:hypothetical protein
LSWVSILVSRLGSALRLAVAVVSVLAILWAIVYRLILGITPLWFDVATLVAAGIGALVLVIAARLKSQAREA